jgi:hypothetical protein
MRKIATLALLALSLLVSQRLYAGSVKSGPEVGQKVPGAFKPLHVTGPDAGQRACLYCKYGARPVAVVFAREITPLVGLLMMKIDAVVAARQEDARLASYAVFLGAPERISPTVKQMGERFGIRHCVLTVDDEAPKSYAIAPDAAVTVLLYHRHTVKANHAFKAGELGSRGIEAILADLNRMLPAK